jgi:hypothetical protein
MQGLRWLERAYGTSSTLTLGVFRIYFGCVLLYGLARHVPSMKLVFTNEGLLSNHFNLFRPPWGPVLSVFTPFSTPTEVKVAFGLTALVYLLYTVGLYTRVMQVLALICLLGLTHRNQLLENGGTVVMHILATFTVLLPLGERLSLDAIRRRYRDARDPTHPPPPAEPRPVRSLLIVGLTLQIAAIYFFNVKHKTGEGWQNGDAVHWALWQIHLVTPIATWLQTHEPSWLSPIATRATLVTETLLYVIALSPVLQTRARPVGLLLAVGLHLSFAVLMELTYFSYAMIGLWVFLLPEDSLRAAWRRFGPARPPRRIVYVDRGHANAVFLARVLVALDGGNRLTVRDAVEDEGRARVSLRAGSHTGAAAFAAGLARVPVMGRFLARLASIGAVTETLDSWLTDGAVSSPPEAAPVRRRPASPHILGFARETFALALMAAVALQITVDCPYIPRKYAKAPPPWLAPLIQYPRLYQGWKMFAPDVQHHDGLVVLDAVTESGRHIDPTTGRDFIADQPYEPHERLLEEHLSKLGWAGREYLRIELERYLEHWHEYERRPAGDRIVSYRVWWASREAPPPGGTTPGPWRLDVLLEK